MEVPFDEIVLLQAAQAFPDFAGPHGPHAVDRLEIPLGGPDDRVEAAEVADDPPDQRLRDPRDVGEDAVAARLDRVVERVDAPVVAEQLPEPLELEQVVVAECAQALERQRRLCVVAGGVLVTWMTWCTIEVSLSLSVTINDTMYEVAAP